MEGEMKAKVVIKKVVVNFGLSFAALLIATVMSEVALREIDGYQIFALRLIPTEVENKEGAIANYDPLLDRVAKQASSLPIEWFYSDPPAISKGQTTAAIQERLSKYPTDPYGATFLWNKNYLIKAVCEKSTLGSFGILNEFYYFDSLEESIHPIYRHKPNLQMPGMFRTNSFGWRGPDIAFNKPGNTIRIAFVGASTTINGYGEKYSYPEYIGYWLNLWAKEQHLPLQFEVINAGRTGIASPSIAAIVRQELLPVRPDFVVYYEGANQFHPSNYVAFADNSIPQKPTVTFRTRSASENYSALVRRFFQVIDRFVGAGGYEPPKPAFTVEWPRDLDEANPSIRYPKLPLQLNDIVSDLDSMRENLAGIHSELIISSFVWLASDGMQVDMERNPGVYKFLNETFWPFTYGHVRRMADFQNRVFKNYADTYRLPYIDVAGNYPMDPKFFGDAIHMTQQGVRLHAWIALPQLISIIRQRIDQGALPVRYQAQQGGHPAFAQSDEQMVTREQLQTKCKP